MSRTRSTVHPSRAWILAAAALVGAIAAALAHAAGGGTVQLGRTSLGRILVDARGHTLYVFAADRHGKSACYGQCATFWPPLLAAKPAAGAGVRAALLGTTRRTDGKLQVTYRGHPLYRFAKDTKRGETAGEGVNAAGGLWWAVSPAGAAVKRTAATASSSGNAAAPPATTTTSSGGYYGGGYGG